MTPGLRPFKRVWSLHVLDRVFIHVLEPDRHGQLRCQSLTVTPSSYYDGKHTIDLRQIMETVNEVAHTTGKHLLDI